jgi:hypothetical protein
MVAVTSASSHHVSTLAMANMKLAYYASLLDGSVQRITDAGGLAGGFVLAQPTPLAGTDTGP